MKMRDIAAHKAVASFMTYQQLQDMVNSLKKEKEEMAPHISDIHAKDYDILIEIYSNEMKFLISMLTARNYKPIVH